MAMCHRVRIAAAVCAALLVAGCGAAPSTGTGPEAPELAGTSWVLDALESGGLVVGSPTLTFASGGGLSGSTGCNSFGGEYEQDGSALRIDVSAMTEMACSGALGLQERRVLAALDSTAAVSGGGAALWLLDAEGTLLLSYLPAPSLTGTAWRATGVSTGTAVTVAQDVARITARFVAGQLDGDGVCNTYSASYEEAGDGALTIGPVASTQIACTSGADIEAAYFAALTRVSTFEVRGTELTLRDASGATLVTYVAT
jgi:heat shock protein HslJ